MDTAYHLPSDSVVNAQDGSYELFEEGLFCEECDEWVRWVDASDRARAYFRHGRDEYSEEECSKRSLYLERLEEVENIGLILPRFQTYRRLKRHVLSTLEREMGSSLSTWNATFNKVRWNATSDKIGWSPRVRQFVFSFYWSAQRILSNKILEERGYISSPRVSNFWNEVDNEKIKLRDSQVVCSGSEEQVRVFLNFLEIASSIDSDMMYQLASLILGKAYSDKLLQFYVTDKGVFEVKKSTIDALLPLSNLDDFPTDIKESSTYFYRRKDSCFYQEVDNYFYRKTESKSKELESLGKIFASWTANYFYVFPYASLTAKD